MKPYTRGDFRAIKTATGFYQIQSRDRDGFWNSIGCSFDYLSNARLRVRNLHAACCVPFELIEQPGFPNFAKRYIQTGKSKLTTP